MTNRKFFFSTCVKLGIGSAPHKDRHCLPIRIRIGTYKHGNLDPDRHQNDNDPQQCTVARCDYYLVSSHLPGDFAELFLSGGHYLNTTDPPLNLLIYSTIKRNVSRFPLTVLQCWNLKILAKIEGKEAKFFQKFTKGI